MKEEWKQIKGFQYEISINGRFRRIGKEKCNTPNVTNKGYLEAQLRKNSKRYCFYIHRLVAQAFIPNPSGKEQVNHIDGIKSNNVTSNLEWNTSKENWKHVVCNGLQGGLREYSNNDVSKVYNLLNDGVSHKQVAIRMNMTLKRVRIISKMGGRPIKTI